MNIQNLIDAYKKMFANVEWHIKTNEPKGSDLQICQEKLSHYTDIIQELESLDESKAAIARLAQKHNEIDFCEWVGNNFIQTYSADGSVRWEEKKDSRFYKTAELWNLKSPSPEPSLGVSAEELHNAYPVHKIFESNQQPEEEAKVERERRVDFLYGQNRPKFQDWGTLKQMCIATAIQYADEYASSLLTQREDTIRENGKEIDRLYGAIEDAAQENFRIIKLLEETFKDDHRAYLITNNRVVTEEILNHKWQEFKKEHLLSQQKEP